MSDTKIDHSKKYPKYFAYHVRQGKDGEKGFWTRIGVAWAHKDGNGVDIQLDGVVPLDGRITCRIPDPKENA
jgi:hypothetical protein